LHRARGPGGARMLPAHGIHDGAEAPADHGGEEAREPRRGRARPRVRSALARAADAAPARRRPRRPRVRRLGVEARDARAVVAQGVPRGAGADPRIDRPHGKRWAMSPMPFAPTDVQALGWSLLHFLWQGAAAALALAVVDLGLRRAAP